MLSDGKFDCGMAEDMLYTPQIPSNIEKPQPYASVQYDLFFQALFVDICGSCQLRLHEREYWHCIDDFQVLGFDWPNR